MASGRAAPKTPRQPGVDLVELDAGQIAEGVDVIPELLLSCGRKLRQRGERESARDLQPNQRVDVSSVASAATRSSSAAASATNSHKRSCTSVAALTRPWSIAHADTPCSASGTTRRSATPPHRRRNWSTPPTKTRGSILSGVGRRRDPPRERERRDQAPPDRASTRSAVASVPEEGPPAGNANDGAQREV